MSIPIDTKESIDICVPEYTVNDTIFRSKKNLQRCLPSEDPTYALPDHQRYVFSSKCSNITALYPNNILIPVRVKTSFNNEVIYRELITKGVDENETSGVYVVDYYRFYFDPEHNTDTLADLLCYYRSTNTLNVDELTLSKLKNIFKPDDRYRLESNLGVRVVTFLSDAVLNEVGYAYVPSLDMVFTNLEVTTRLVHPKSKQYHPNFRKNEEPSKTVITIDLVDNESDEPMYINVGNSIEKIHPRRDILSVSKATISVAKDRIQQTCKETTLDKAGSVLGLYNSRVEAKYQGDKRGELEVIKINNELTMSNNKLKLAEMEISKKSVEMSMFISKSNIEIKQYAIKNKLELETYLTKANTERENTAAKVAYEKEAYLLKAETDKELTELKLKNENVKFLGDTASRVLNLVAVVLRIL